MTRHELTMSLEAYHEHNAARIRPKILKKLAGGKKISLVSAVVIPVTALPGPLAVVTALAIAGLPTDKFVFVGFLPSRASEAREALASLASFVRLPATLALFESARRSVDTLKPLASVASQQRFAGFAHELAKVCEEVLTAPASELASLVEAGLLCGEVVLLLGPPTAIKTTEDQDANALERLPSSRAASKVTRSPALLAGNCSGALWNSTLQTQRLDRGRAHV